MLTCNGDEAQQKEPPKYHIGAAFGVFGSDLTFGGRVGELGLERRAVLGTFEIRATEKMTFQLSAGPALPGHLTRDTGDPNGPERIDLRPGGLAGFAVSWRVSDGAGSAPFVLMSMTVAGSVASTNRPKVMETAPFVAIDARFGLTVGKTFFDRLSPYAGARVFGGPVIWKYDHSAQGGTDVRHYQLALGLLTAMPHMLDLFAEVAPLGERAVTIGGGRSF